MGATIRQNMKPELLNRLDEVVVFNPLIGPVLRKVVRLQLNDVCKRLEDLNVSMHMTDAAVEHALQEAHDPLMGARPLKRFLERHVVSRLSTLILKDELTSGSSVTVDWPADGSDWDFRVTPGPELSGVEDMHGLPSATLGRAGSRDHRDTEGLFRTDSIPKRQRV